MKKILTLVMVLGTILLLSPTICASEKVDINIYNEISESKEFIFGNFFGVKYSLNDRKVQDEIAKLIDSYKESYQTSDDIIKTYDFIITTDKYKIGLLNHTLENGEYYFSLIDKNNAYRFNTYIIKKNIYPEIVKILNSTEKVSIDKDYYNNNFTRNNGIYMKENMIESSIQISEITFARSRNIVLVGKDSIADSLCSSSLAGYLNAPILLSDKDTLNKKILEELNRLNVKNIHITSGDRVISKKVKDELKSRGYNILDYSGVDRYETSNRIAKSISKNNKFILASGENFNDIPSISPYAYENKIPIILTNRNNFKKYNYDLLNKDSNILAVGGYMTIDKGVYMQLSKRGIKPKRIAGVDRFETSKLIIKKLYPNSKSFIYESDNSIVKNIITSSMSVKYKKPIQIVKDIVHISRINQEKKGSLYIIP